MELKGKIKSLKKLVVSDPYYDKNVFCRYQKNRLGSKEWDVEIMTYNDDDGYGINVHIILKRPNEFFELSADKNSFRTYQRKRKSYMIGMDTASIAIGANEFADMILESKDDWQPDCAICTTTDGIFGYVYEGIADREVKYIYIDGFIPNDAMLSHKDIFDYLISQLCIEDAKFLF